MQNAGLDEVQAGIKIVKRNINNLRYADDTYGRKQRRTKEPLDESESEKTGLKLNIQKTKIIALSHHFMANRWGNTGNSEKFIFLGSKNHCRW